jgi:MFS family permease
VLANYARVVRSPRYSLIWVGQLISNLGDTVNYVALVVEVFRLTGSGIALSTLVVFQVMPVILTGPLIGAVIDRFSRKRVLIAADLVRSLLVVGLIFATTIWQVYALAACMALATAFFSPALSASIPALVEGQDLLAANSVAWSTAQLVQIAGSAAAGGLIAFFGVRAAFGFNAMSFLVSALSTSVVTFPVLTGIAKESYWRSVRDGISYALGDKFVSRMFSVQVLASLSVGGTSALLVVLAERRYHLPPAGFATFLFAIATGAILGPFILGYLTRNYRDARLLFLPYIVRGFGDILLGIFTFPLLGQAVLFIYGLNTSTGMVTYQSAMQSEVPDRVRGRVFSFMDVGWSSARLVSVALADVLADRFGIAVVYYIGGLLLILAGGIGLQTVRLGSTAKVTIES